MSRTLTAARVTTLVGDFDRSPAYLGLADALRLLIGDGRIPLDTRLPSERELTGALGVSRTTVTRAYAELRSSGYAAARHGSGTYTRLPGGRARIRDNALLPYAGDENAIDLNCAAGSAPPGVATAYAEAAAELPAHLAGHGYFPAGLPRLQASIAATFDARGLPTRPDQIMVTPGALTATAIVAKAFTGPRDRALIESPVYPNATQAIRNSGVRLVPSPVDPEGWDLDAIGELLRQTRPTLAYLIPDFQNPTGRLMSAEDRERYAAHLRGSGTLAVVDEAHQFLALDGQEMPPPFAVYAPGTVTIGSASKSFWGGLRLGWIRAADSAQMLAFTRARVGLDLGAPVLEQLALVQLLRDPEPVLTAHRDRLRQQRNRLLAALAEHLPDWRFVRPGGGLSVWCQLPERGATALAAEAEQRGVLLAPGPIFAAEGGLDRFIRIPWTAPADLLEEAIRRLAEAWKVVDAAPTPRPRLVVA
ncbi:PLP-dependent aminotransferase family protein [Stackebrandtia nassauensis]|uniref:Transcriptional regulator, GntR family with aminotransferase domain protein n=1 Tax=Stackebrandtia nassauensis (strain DSM 44728 / CIP 108903 / NRRL B-16338 / NBRC 102104 / LLR-40K-21) TaxID=446470 RepID=D3Q7A6_STANL|nr:PLP-dependent aminotransferase family protein [Stackebrandtia nassauensis]ADD42377.1 transcriptional regulator, GntR family with aminotransferase domain protein [Stackebrandtia nassauensis DSM 44728]